MRNRPIDDRRRNPTRPHTVAGFRDAALHRSLDDPDSYIVIGHWDASAAYREWQALSGDDAPGLGELLDSLRDLQRGHLFHLVTYSGEQLDSAHGSAEP